MPPDDEDLYDEALLSDIAPNIMAVLIRDKFFTRLEARVFPDSPDPRNLCDHSFSNASVLLAEDGHDEDAQEDVFAVMRSRGGFCDCEIIWNVAEGSPVTENYWRTRAVSQSPS
jgi:Protein of unknown function (DUF2695)